MNDKDIERIQQEVHTPNHVKMYERRKAEAKPRNDVTLTELKVSHHNHYIDHQNKMVEEELIELINERGK